MVVLQAVAELFAQKAVLSSYSHKRQSVVELFAQKALMESLERVSTRVVVVVVVVVAQPDCLPTLVRMSQA